MLVLCCIPDRFFADGLAARLGARGRATVVGTDLPPDAPPSIVCVLSPDAAASEEWRAAVEAVPPGARLVPVVCRDVAPADLPQAMAARNWIFLRPGDDRERGFAALGSALDTDLAWVKSHERLQGRAHEWDARTRNRALLLRGADLRDAETLVSQTDKEPPPTGLQADYVLESRRRETARQRGTLTGVSIALALTLLLTVLAVVQRSSANREREGALVEELVAAARTQLTQDPQLAALLAREAYARRQSPQALEILREALLTSRLVSTVHIGSAEIASVAVMADSKTAVGGDVHGSVAVTDLRSGKVVRRFDANDRPVLEVIAARTGDNVLVVSDRVMSMWDAAAGRKIRSYSSGGTFTTARLSGDGKLILAGGADGTATLLDANTGRALGRYGKHSGRVTGVEFIEQGKTVVTVGVDGTVRSFKRAGGAFLGAFDLAQPLVLSAADPRGGSFTVLNATGGGTVMAADPRSPKHTGTVSLFGAQEGAPRAIAYSFDGGRLATAGDDGGANVKLPGFGVLQQFTLRGHRGAVTGVGFTPDGSRVITAGADGTMRVWDGTLTASDKQFPSQRDTRVEDAVITRDGSKIVVGYGSISGHEGPGSLVIYDTKTRESVRTTTFPSGIVSVDLTRDGKHIAAMENNGTVHIIDAETSAETSWRTGARVGGAVCYTRDAKGLFVGTSDGKSAIWDPATRQIVARVAASPAPSIVVGCANSPDGSTFAAGDEESGNFYLWKSSGGEPIATLSGHHGAIKRARFNRDGTRLLTAGFDGDVRLWDVKSKRLIAQLAHGNTVYDANWLAGERVIVACGASDPGTMWNARTFTRIGSLTAPASSFSYVCVVSPDGRSITIGGQQGAVNSSERSLLATFSCTACTGRASDLFTLFSQRIKRTLTDDERRRFVHA